LDRIAIHVAVQPVDLEMWSSSSPRMSSVEMRNKVACARDIQAHRYKSLDGIDCNARLPDGLFSRFCVVVSSAETLFLKAQESLLVSARARGHILRVARTIADLGGSDGIAERYMYIMEAVGYPGNS
jgi:magnesium chelatase family protein